MFSYKCTLYISLIKNTEKNIKLQPFFWFAHLIGLDSEELHGSEKHNLGERPQLNWQRINQTSIILMSKVGGRPSILLMKIVVITSMVVKFTLKAASKKKGLKKVVA